MTNVELTTIAGAIVTGLGAIGGILRWAATAIVDAIKGGHKVVDRNTEALIKNTEATVELKGHIVATKEAAQDTRDAVVAIADEVSGVHDAAPMPNGAADEEDILAGPSPRRTPPGGYAIGRRKGTRS